MTPAGTSNELDVQNEWEENTHTHVRTRQAHRPFCSKPPFEDQILRRERGQEILIFPVQLTTSRRIVWQPYPVDPYSCYMCNHNIGEKPNAILYTYDAGKPESHLNVMTFFSLPDWGLLRRSRCVQIFLLKQKQCSLEKNLNASRPPLSSEHPQSGGKMSKRFGEIIGCKYTKSLHGIYMGSRIVVTVGQQYNNIPGRNPPLCCTGTLLTSIAMQGHQTKTKQKHF